MKFVKYFLILAVCCIVLGAASVFGLYKYVEPQLPDVATLKDVRLQIPMQVYSADGELIAQYGEKRRIPLKLDQIPPVMVRAFIATEDSRFMSTTALTRSVSSAPRRWRWSPATRPRGQVPSPNSSPETSS